LARRRAKTGIHIYLFRLFEKAVSVNFKGADLATQLNIQAPMRGIVSDKADKNCINGVYMLIRQICSSGQVDKNPKRSRG